MKLRARFRCHQRFTEMRPVPGGRHCELCSKTVHDLSALTKREARALLERGAREEGGVCGRVRLDERGHALFRRPPRSRWLEPGGWVIAAAALLGGCEGVDYVAPSTSALEGAPQADSDAGVDGDGGAWGDPTLTEIDLLDRVVTDPGWAESEEGQRQIREALDGEPQRPFIADPDWALAGEPPPGHAGGEGSGEGSEEAGADDGHPRVIELEMIGDLMFDPETDGLLPPGEGYELRPSE